MDPTSNIAVCDQQQVTVPAFSSTPTGSTFAWSNSTPSIGLAGAGAGNINPFTGTRGGVATAVSGTVSVTPTLNGCVGPPATFVITISPQPTLTLTSPPITCPGNVVPAPTYTLNPNDPSTVFAWVNSNTNTGMAANGGPTIPGSFTAASNATLANITSVVTVTPAIGTCVGQPATYTVTIYPTPVINPIADVEYCPGVASNTVAISMIPVSGGVQSYNWSAPSGASIGLTPNTGNTNTVPSFNTANAGTTAATSQVIVSGGLNGCPALPVSFNITVNPNPVANFSHSSHVCLGSAMQFSDLSVGSIATWAWNLDNSPASFSVIQNPQSIITPCGSHTIGLTVTTAKGCKNSTTQPIYINCVPVANFTGGGNGCPDLVLNNFADASTPTTSPGAVVGWSWSLGNGYTSSAQTPVGPFVYTNSSPTANMNYTVSLTVFSDSGCVSAPKTSVPVTVNPHPLAGFTYGPQDPAPDIDNPVVYFMDQSLGASGPNSYGQNGIMWNLGDIFLNPQSGNILMGVQNPIHKYDHSDPYTYNVTQWVQNAYGCKDSITKTVEIKPTFTFYIPNAFSPNGDGINEGFKGTGIGIDNSTYNLWVFDRWGMQIFYSNDLEKAWDGHIQGKGGDIVMEDVYVWKVKFKDFTGRKHEYKGTVSVIK